jgi:hypothetical protein
MHNSARQNSRWEMEQRKLYILYPNKIISQLPIQGAYKKINNPWKCYNKVRGASHTIVLSAVLCGDYQPEFIIIIIIIRTIHILDII